jgi:N-sulfoglucosamine sulfohydrolase
MSLLRPNILYLHSHDTGRLVQPYGQPFPTPHLQAFAEQGVLFRRAYSAAPTCSPSRAALLTGMYPHACGMHGLASQPWNYRVNFPERLLPNVLAAHGYRTALGGVHHIGGKTVADTRAHGFQVLLNDSNRCEDVPDLHERAAEFLTHRHPAPRFLAVGFDQTHRDNRQGDPASGTCFSQPSPYDPLQLPPYAIAPPAPLPDTPETRRDLASFAEGARRLDDESATSSPRWGAAARPKILSASSPRITAPRSPA